MSKIYDVAKYIIAQKDGEMSAMKFQKLMYYAQAWNLVWEEKPLFDEDFQAWANGPVIPQLYAYHRKQFSVTNDTFKFANVSNLTETEKDNIDQVLKYYGDKTAQYLSALTHQEDPWKDARAENKCAPGERCEAGISKASIHEYYSSL